MAKRVIGNPTITPMAVPDWNQTDPTKADYIKNKPIVFEEGFGVPFDEAGTNLVTIDKVHPKEHDVEVVTDAESVNVLGKNFVPFPYLKMSAEMNGVTFTVNEDGTIVANGTATGGSAHFVTTYWGSNPLPVGTYTLSGAPIKGTRISVGGDVGATVYGTNGYSGFVNFRITPESWQNNLAFFVENGTTVDNVVFKPMIEAGTVATEYERYKKVTYPVTDGKAIVKSVSPVMNITTPASGVSIEAKGYQDGLAVIDELKQAIISLGGNI